MPPQVNITQQPQSTTNNMPSSGVAFSVTAMGAAPLGYQWYYSQSGTGGTFAPLDSQTNSTLSLSPVLDITNAGSFYVVVTNNFSAATSSVATLTVFRTPFIAQQPVPANLVQYAGTSRTLSVAANGALPLSYYWATNGVPIPGAISPALVMGNLQIANSGNYSVIVSNAYGAVTSSIVSLTVLAPPSYPFAQIVLADHPIAYWKLDETGGTIAHDYVGGLNGLYNLVALNQPGDNLLDTHRAARFGLLASTTSLVTNIPLSFATSTSTNFSVEAWVNGVGQNGDNGLVTKGNGNGGEQFNLDCGGPNHGFRFFVRDSTGATHGGSSSVALNGKWHHVVGVCDQTHTNVFLYVDGTNVARSSIVPGSGLQNSGNPVTVGSRQSGNTTYDLQFAGYMEEVVIYNYALSPAQVQIHYSAVTNRPPVFLSNPVVLSDANAGQFYSSSIATNATDPNGDLITFSKISGPVWLNLSTSGSVSGTPFSPDAGTNNFTIRATDSYGGYSTATMTLNVLAAPAIYSTLSLQGSVLSLTWGGGIAPYQVQMATNLVNPIWQTLGSMTATNFPVSPSNSAAFFRIMGM